MVQRSFLMTGASKGIGRALSTRRGAAIAFLLSDDAGSIMGQTLFVDGVASIGKVPLRCGAGGRGQRRRKMERCEGRFGSPTTRECHPATDDDGSNAGWVIQVGLSQP